MKPPTNTKETLTTIREEENLGTAMPAKTQGVSTDGFRRILFCTDFSSNADEAFDRALSLAHLQAEHVTLHLLHVIPEPDAHFWKTYLYEVDDIDAKARQDIDRKIDTCYRKRVPASISFDVQIRIGRDYACILDYARQEAVDLIILGRQGHSTFRKLWFGNVAEKVVRHAPCPVLVVPPSSLMRQEA